MWTNNYYDAANKSCLELLELFHENALRHKRSHFESYLVAHFMSHTRRYCFDGKLFGRIFRFVAFSSTFIQLAFDISIFVRMWSAFHTHLIITHRPWLSQWSVAPYTERWVVPGKLVWSNGNIRLHRSFHQGSNLCGNLSCSVNSGYVRFNGELLKWRWEIRSLVPEAGI